MPQRRTLTLTPDQLQELFHAPDHDPRPALRERCAALLKVAAGQSPQAVQGSHLDNYIVGHAKVIEFSEQGVAAWPGAYRLYMIEDNGSIPRNPEMLESLKAWPQVEPVWLPTYAPWLNPIEKLWRWLRQEVLKLHRLGGDGKGLRQRVRAFLEQFKAGSQRLLEYVGLRGKGQVARMIHGPQLPILDINIHQVDRERATLIDHIGACERILKAPLPLVFAIKIRRFIALFLLVLPFALIHRMDSDWLVPLVTMLVAYPLLALDQIGIELQNPFAKSSLGHLPLDDISAAIEQNLMGLLTANQAEGSGTPNEPSQGRAGKSLPKVDEIDGNPGERSVNDVGAQSQAR